MADVLLFAVVTYAVVSIPLAFSSFLSDRNVQEFGDAVANFQIGLIADLVVTLLWTMEFVVVAAALQQRTRELRTKLRLGAIIGGAFMSPTVLVGGILGAEWLSILPKNDAALGIVGGLFMFVPAACSTATFYLAFHVARDTTRSGNQGAG